MTRAYANLARLQSPMAQVAAQLGSGRSQPCRLAPLILMSDPERTPDIEALAAKLPTGSALIYRHFGAEDREAVAQRLRKITAARGVQCLIGADAALAKAVGADGVHLPRRNNRVPEIRAEHPDWIITQAGRKSGREDQSVEGLDALFISSVFPSESPSAGTALGPEAFTMLCTSMPCPVIALGGIDMKTAPALIGIGAAGLAAIGGLATEIRTNAMSTAAKPAPSVTITKEETPELITYIAHVEGSEVTGELTLRPVSGSSEAFPGGVWNANHTGVPREIGGRGVGKALIRHMAADARENGYRIIPGCPFVAALFKRDPSLAEGITA